MVISSSHSVPQPHPCTRGHLAMFDNNLNCHDLGKGKATSRHEIMPYRVSL